MDHIPEITGYLSGSKKIAIIMHERPDGDAIGSSLALKHYLVLKGHKPEVIAPTGYPNFLKWLPGEDSIRNHENNAEESLQVVKDADLIFCLDFNQIKRSGELAESIENSNATKIMVDHHLYPADFADVAISRPSASSTAELVYELIVALGDQHLLNKEMALNLYTGIMTDTGSFRFSSTTSNVHRIIADLIDLGAEPDMIYNLVYNSFSLNRLRFFGFCLTRKMVTISEENIAYISVSSDEIKRYNIGVGDTEGLVNFPLKMKNIDVSVLFKEQNGIIKISFRSKGDKDVNLLASKHFNGGGHKNASGGMSNASLEDTVQRFEHLIRDKEFNF